MLRRELVATPIFLASLVQHRGDLFGSCVSHAAQDRKQLSQAKIASWLRAAFHETAVELSPNKWER